jgi:hypothetical protein
MEPSDILDAGKGQDDTVDTIIDTSSDIMETAAVFGGEEGAAAIMAGEAAELGGVAAAAGGATVAAAVVGAGAAGVGIGMLIEKETGAGSAAGDAAYEATSEETHQSALAHAEAAETNWDQGNYGTAVYEGAAVAGTIVEGLAESAVDSVGDALDSINPFSD